MDTNMLQRQFNSNNNKSRNSSVIKQSLSMNQLIIQFIYCYLMISDCLLTIYAIAPEPIPHRSPIRQGYLIRVGQNLTLTCPFDAPFYHWSVLAQPSQILSETRQFHIQSANLKDSNRYVCNAVDGYGRKTSEMSVRVIDFSSRIAQQECAINGNMASVNTNGPCFLMSYTDRDLNPTRSWGSQIVFDCEAVMSTSSTMDSLIYTWEFISYRSLNKLDNNNHNSLHNQRLLARNPQQQQQQQQQTQSRQLASFDIQQHRESELRIDKLTLSHNGEYRCSVTNARQASVNSLSNNTPVAITRSFRLTVKPRTDGRIIQGPKIINETVEAGKDAVFHCQVNPDEHRSSTIRWGKSIDIAERLAYETEGREVIQWAGGTFVVLPIVSDKIVSIMNEKQLRNNLLSPSTSVGAVATEVSSGQSSQLILRNAKLSDAGRYVCSVLTEIGRDDHKFVQIKIIGDVAGQANTLIGSGATHQLTLYIVVPVAILLICLCVVIYCVRSANRRRNNGSRCQRNYFEPMQKTQVKSSSAASTSSVGVCRNGMSATSAVWTSGANTADSGRLRPSTGPNAIINPAMGYVSANGSTSLNGTATQLTSNSYLQTTMPGAVTLLPTTNYPLIIQSMGNQAPAKFYSVPESNTLAHYGQNVSAINTMAGCSEFMIPNNTTTTPNMYPMPNGHITANPNVIPNSLFNSSSPDSSAVGGGQSTMQSPVPPPPPTQSSSSSQQQQQQQQQPTSNDLIDGRMMFGSAATHNAGAGYPVNYMSSQTVPTDYEIGLSNTPLLSYHNHKESVNEVIRT